MEENGELTEIKYCTALPCSRGAQNKVSNRNFDGQKLSEMYLSTSRSFSTDSCSLHTFDLLQSSDIVCGSTCSETRILARGCGESEARCRSSHDSRRPAGLLGLPHPRAAQAQDVWGGSGRTEADWRPRRCQVSIRNAS